MEVTYIDKGKENNFKRVDTIRTIHAIDCFRPENSSLIYFHTDRYNIVTIPAEDIIEIKED